MRLLTLSPLLACFALLSPPLLTSAFKLNVWKESENCTGPADFITDELPSDGACHVFEGGFSIKYSSDVGCSLFTHSDSSCNENEAWTEQQDVCFFADYKIFGYSCIDKSGD